MPKERFEPEQYTELTLGVHPDNPREPQRLPVYRVYKDDELTEPSPFEVRFDPSQQADPLDLRSLDTFEENTTDDISRGREVAVRMTLEIAFANHDPKLISYLETVGREINDPWFDHAIIPFAKAVELPLQLGDEPDTGASP